MTRQDVLKSYHEPFGDAFYYGPECHSQRFKDDPVAREESGMASTTYQDVYRSFEEADKEVRLLQPSKPF